jgi:hypothetical protein
MSSHRLHDFMELGQQIFAGIGEDPARFVGLMDEMRRASGAEIAAGDDFIVAVQKVLHGMVTKVPAGDALPGYKSWFPDGYVGCRHSAGGAIVGIRPRALVEKLGPAQYGRDWLPKNERDLKGALLRTGPIWGDIGVHISQKVPSKGNVYWEFRLSGTAVEALVNVE